MSVGGPLTKVLTSYGVSVLIVTIFILWWGSFPGGVRSLDWAAVELGLKVSAVFSLPVFILAGLPYMAFGYRSWGRNHRLPFVLVGGVLGALGAASFGALLTMPRPFPPVLIAIGLAAGLAASYSWAWVSHRLEPRNA